MAKSKTFTDTEKEEIIKLYTIDRLSAKKIGEQYGCSAPTLLKNLKSWGITANSKALDLSGQIFGQLKVLHQAVRRDDRYTRWVCECSCGNITEVRTDYLTSGHTTSCGCALKQANKNRAIDLTGQVFGEWTVLGRGTKESYWKCKCSCGVEREVFANSLKNGVSTSCGHLHKNDIRKPIIGNRYGKLVVLEQFKQGDDQYCLCQCDCGNKTLIRRSNLISGNTQSCGCISSKGEARITRILQEKNIPFVSQWTPSEFYSKRYKYDFYVDNKYVIEFDGPQHTGQVGGFYTQEKVDALIERDKEKNKYCLDHNIPLYRIPYEMRDTMTLEDLTLDKFRVKAPDMEEAQEE